MSASPWLVEGSYFVAALAFILGLKRMSSPRTARGGIRWAGAGMLLATAATFALPELAHRGLMLAAVLLGTGAAWWSGRRVAMTGMPQMVALYNGMGGGAAAAIGAAELVGVAAASVTLLDGRRFTAGPAPGILQSGPAVLGALIGAVSFAGSLIAFAKLQGWLDRRVVFPWQRVLNMLVLLLALLLGGWLLAGRIELQAIAGFFLAALAFGVLMTLPIGGADMPVVISLYNALTGLAVALEGYVLGNAAMIIAGIVVGAAGSLLTRLMARAMNRSLGNVLFGSFGAAVATTQAAGGSLKPIEASDAAAMMAYAGRVVIVPGYGMAVAQAQHKVWEFARLLIERGVRVRFAIHPVAGRMPGHMNVLLAEAGVPYDLIADMDEINPELPGTDVALVIGANDVVNPAARTDPASPIYGMPVLDVAAAHQVIVVKRGRGTGFAGIGNALFDADNARMLFGDGEAVAAELVAALKALDG